MTVEKVDFPVNCFRVCIDLMRENRLEGVICGVAVEENRIFHSAAELLLKLNDTMNAVGKPQSYEQIRTFVQENQDGYIPYCADPKKHYDSDTIRRMQGKICTIDVLVQTRKHANLQGIVIDHLGITVFHFESDLELIDFIMKEAREKSDRGY